MITKDDCSAALIAGGRACQYAAHAVNRFQYMKDINLSKSARASLATHLAVHGRLEIPVRGVVEDVAFVLHDALFDAPWEEGL